MSIGRVEDLYSPPSLAEVGERLAGQFAEFAARPSRDGADHLLMSLTQARSVVAQKRTELEREQAA